MTVPGSADELLGVLMIGNYWECKRQLLGVLETVPGSADELLGVVMKGDVTGAGISEAVNKTKG